MRKTNRVFLFVLVLLAALIAVTWQAVQSERVGSILSEKTNNLLMEKAGVEVSFERIQISLWPLGTRIKNVKAENDFASIEAGSVNFEFGIRDLFSKKFSVGKIKIQDSIVELKGTIPFLDKKEEESQKDFNLEDIKFDEIFSKYKEVFYEDLPFVIRGFSLVDTNVYYKTNVLRFSNLSLGFFKSVVVSEFSFSSNNALLKNAYPEWPKNLHLDGLMGRFQLTPSYLRILNFKLLFQNNFIQLSGKVGNSLEVNELLIDSYGDLSMVKNAIPLTESDKRIFPSGFLRVIGKLNGNLGNFTSEFELIGKNLKSNFYDFSDASALVSINKDRVNLVSATANVGNGRLIISEQVEVLKYAEGKLLFTWPKLFINTENIFTNDLLFFLPSLESAKAYLNGPATFDIKKNKLEIKTFEGFQVSDFHLKNKANTGDILQNPELTLSPGSIISAFFDGKVSFDIGLSFPGSKFGLMGDIGQGKLNVSLTPGVVDLKEFGPISGLELMGRGPVRGSILGDIDKPVFNFDLNPSEFKLLGFELGTMKGNLVYRLEEAKLSLNNIKGKFDSLEYSAYGGIFFDRKDNELDVSIEIKKSTLTQARKSFVPILGALEKYLKNVKLNFNTSLSLQGGFKSDKMRVAGLLYADNIFVLGEDFEKLTSHYNLDEGQLKLSNVNFKKVTGNFSGEMEYNLLKKDYSYKGTLSNFRLKDSFYYRNLNFGLDGDLYGEFYGVGDEDVFSSRSHVRITNSIVDSVRLDDSVLTVYNNKDDVFFSTSFIGGEVKGEGYLNLSEKQNKKSAFNFKLSSDDIKNLLGALGKHNISNGNLEGIVNADIDANFFLRKPTKLNLVANLNDFNFKYPGIFIKKSDKPIKVQVSEGDISDWNIDLEGEGISIQSVGNGNFDQKFNFNQKFEVNSSLGELITDKIEKSSGVIRGDHSFYGSLEEFNQLINIETEGVTTKFQALPGVVSNINLAVQVENENVFIEKLNGIYGNGKLIVGGGIKIKFPFPEMDLSIGVEKARVPLLKRSGVVVSGDLTLKGKKLPYRLSGDLALIQGEITEEMSDLASSAIDNETYQRFVPIGYLEGSVSFINSDLRVTSFSPIQIRNGLINLGLGGNLRIFGSVSNPMFNGVLAIENNENKFLFKGHEFNLSEGEVRFLDQNRKESPELRFSGLTTINDYDVYINLNGPADNLTVEMSSNPPLSQEDILSLLTLGVTSDVSKNLEEKQRQSVTTLSIGSLIMDQLKINQSLNDSLGLRLSLQPEFVEDENNLLEGRVDNSTGGNRFRSSTVLKVQKKISKKVNLSLSSTVGGSVDQNQEMNVNYKINKSWSVEGVYEVRSNDELEQELPDSVGADLKYQWSF